MATTRQHGTTPVPPTEGLTVIGQGIHVEGQIHGEEDLRIEGQVFGAISLTETVHVAQSGVVKATIDARDVVVSGVVVGNVSATNSVSLEPGAKLVGDIRAPRIIIADGAAFRGNVAMGDAPPAAARPKAATTSRPAVSVASRPRPAASTAATRPAPAARATPAARAPERAVAPRVAAIRPSKAGAPDEEVTVIVRHAALGEDDEGTESAAKKATKKAPPRGRVPKPGKRRVNRR